MCWKKLASSLLVLHLVRNQEGTGQDRVFPFFSDDPGCYWLRQCMCDGLPISITVRNPWSGEKISGFSYLMKSCNTPRRAGKEKKETDTHHSFYPAMHTVAVDKRDLLYHFC